MMFNNTTNTEFLHNSPKPFKLFELDMMWVVITTSVMAMVLVLTVVGNLAVMIVFASSDALRSTVNNHFLFSLALADLLVGLLVMPCAIDTLRTQTWRCGIFMKSFNGFGNFCFCISSIMHLMMLSVDKYLSIVRPLQYPSIMTPGRVYLACVVVWLYSGFWALLPLMGVSSYECFIPYLGVCAAEDWSMYGLNFAFAVSVVSGTYGIALLIMFYVYWKIAKVVKKQNKRVEVVQVEPQTMDIADQSDTKRKRKRPFKHHKGLLTLIILIITYLVCWSPFCILLFIEIGRGKKMATIASMFGMLVGFINSCCNPIIYWAQFKTFRKAVIRLCKNVLPFLPNSLLSSSVFAFSQTAPENTTYNLRVKRVVERMDRNDNSVD